MINLDANASITVDPSTPFCAYSYYSGLRAEGRDPIVRNGALHVLVKESSENNYGRWAALRDPSGDLRLDYARAMWAARTSDDEVILLGARQ